MKKLFILLCVFPLTILFAGCVGAITASNANTSIAPATNNYLNYTGFLDEYKLCDCGEHYAHERRRIPAPPLNLNEPGFPPPTICNMDVMLSFEDSQALVAEFLSGFETVHEVTYIQVGNEYNTLVIWSDEILRDFSFMPVEERWPDNGQGFIYTGETLLNIDKLRPGEAIALNLAFNAIGHAAGGLVFTSENGTEKRMLITEGGNRGHICDARFELWLYDKTDGRLSWDLR